MYKYIDDACINMNVYRENIYVYVLCFTSKVDKQTDRAFPSNSFLLSTFSFSSFKISHILASFWAFMHRFGLKFSRVLLTYNKYLSSAVKTSRANNTPKVL